MRDPEIGVSFTIRKNSFTLSKVGIRKMTFAARSCDERKVITKLLSCRFSSFRVEDVSSSSDKDVVQTPRTKTKRLSQIPVGMNVGQIKACFVTIDGG